MDRFREITARSFISEPVAAKVSTTLKDAFFITPPFDKISQGSPSKNVAEAINFVASITIRRLPPARNRYSPLHQLNSLPTSLITGIRLNTTKLIGMEVFQSCRHLLINAIFLNATATVYQEPYFLLELTQTNGQCFLCRTQPLQDCQDSKLFIALFWIKSLSNGSLSTFSSYSTEIAIHDPE